MNNIKKVVFYIACCFLIGWFSLDAISFALKVLNIQNNKINYTYLLGFSILLPLNQYMKIQPQLDSTKLVNGLKESEILRLNNILDLKRKQLKVIMCLLLMLTLLPLIINMLLSQPIDYLFRALIGASLANIVYVFYSIRVSEDIASFEKYLFLKAQKKAKKDRLLDEIEK